MRVRAKFAGLIGRQYEFNNAWWHHIARDNSRFDPKTAWSQRNQAFFVHIPKTAGTSLYKTLGMDSMAYTHTPAAVLQLLYPKEFEYYFVFSIVRNPWDRFVSIFEHLKHGTDWKRQKEWAKHHIGSKSFTDFVKRLDSSFIFRRSVLSEDFFFPQSYFLSDSNGSLMVSNIFRFENIADSMRDLKARFGSSGEEHHERNSGRKRDFRSYYDDESAEIIGRMYSDDVKLFGYEF